MEPIKTKRIVMVGISVNIVGIAAGTCIGWNSPTEIKFKSENSHDSPLSKPINSSEEAWISSLLPLGALIAPFAAGLLANKVGRKWTLLCSSAFFTISYILMLVASEIWTILLGRLFQGFGVGFVMAVQPIYLSEIASDNIRGALCSLINLFYVCGILYCFIIGPYVSYKTLQYFCLAVPVIFAVIFVFMPESPYYYVEKGQKEKAIKALKFLRGENESDVQNELTQIQATIDEAMSTKNPIYDIIHNPGNRKAFLISACMISLQQLTGIDVVLFNSESIFKSSNSTLDPALSTIIIGIVQVIASCITIFIIDRVGRKIIFMTAACFMSVSLTALGAYFCMQITVKDTSNVNWLPLPALMIFIIAFNAGFGAIPWTVMGEILPTNVRSIAASICATICWVLVFLITFSYPMLVPYGPYYVFWACAIFCILAFFFTLFFVIETKGLSLQEIQDKLNRKKA